MKKKGLRQWMAPFATVTLILNTGYGILGGTDVAASALPAKEHSWNLKNPGIEQSHANVLAGQGRYAKVGSGTGVTTLTEVDGQRTYINRIIKTLANQTAALSITSGEVSHLTAVPADTTKMNLSWTNPTDTNFDHVKVSVSTDVYVDNIKSNSYMMSGLQPDTTYNFRVQTVDKSGNESQGTSVQAKTASVVPVDKTPPGEVSGLTATNVGYNAFTVNYILPKDADLSQAIIYLNDREVQRTLGTSYTFSGLIASTNYTVTVKTVDKSGNVSGGVSIPVTTPTVSVDTSSVPDVTGATVTSVGNQSISISWTRPSGISTVSLYLDGQLITDSSGTTYTFTNLTAARSYGITIKSKRSTGALSSGVKLSATTNSSSSTSEVTNLEVDSKDETWIKITYDIPSEAQRVKIYVDNDYRGATTSESYNITNLRTGRWYVIKVVAVKSNGGESSGVSLSERTDTSYSSSSSSSSDYEEARDLMRTAENNLSASSWRAARDAISDLPSGSRKSDLLDRLEAIRNRVFNTSGSSTTTSTSTGTTTSGSASVYSNNAVAPYATSFTLTPGAKYAYVDGRAMSIDQAPQIINGVTMVPLRFISERVGYQVNYEKGTKRILMNRPTEGKQVILQIKNPKMVVYELNISRNSSTPITAPIIVKGYTLVPLRAISELSGYQVNYSAASKQITITK
ncbi:stalk domain-containing protein [Paenibacillus sp. 8b26]|uniref:stalk domain-containing protein n=1 Tax=Paenibacillus sp. 8b26 TaxID=3424133 RepID=UPI003D660166